MRDYRQTKLIEAIMTQSQLDPKAASKLAQSIETRVDWNQNKKSYHDIVRPFLETDGLLRSQNSRSCRIRNVFKMNKKKK